MRSNISRRVAGTGSSGLSGPSGLCGSTIKNDKTAPLTKRTPLQAEKGLGRESFFDRVLAMSAQT
jgi:hypothetical protein